MTISLRTTANSYASYAGQSLLSYLGPKNAKGNSSLFTDQSTTGTNPLLSLLANGSNSSASLLATYNQFGKMNTNSQSSLIGQMPTLTDDDRSELAKLIKSSDVNKDGKISKDDITQMKTKLSETLKALQKTKTTSSNQKKENQAKISSTIRQINYVNYLDQNYAYLSASASYNKVLA